MPRPFELDDVRGLAATQPWEDDEDDAEDDEGPRLTCVKPPSDVPALESAWSAAGEAASAELSLVGAAESLQVSPMWLLMGCRSVKGWYSGTSIDSQDTLAFSVLAGVRAMNETYPLERVSEAYDRMMSGKARFRVVLTIGE